MERIFHGSSRKKHIHFSFDYMPDTDYRTLADVEKLERIYFNLLSNAFKFTPENGKVTVRLSSLTKDRSLLDSLYRCQYRFNDFCGAYPEYFRPFL